MRLTARWTWSLMRNWRGVVKSRNLKQADAALGPGPFKVHHPAASSAFEIAGPEAVSGIREMYVRDAYLGDGLLEIRDGDVVVDLGANMGNFTNLALAHGPSVRVIAVEPSARLNELFEISVTRNGWRDRVTLLRAFVGTDLSDPVAVAHADEYKGAELLSETDIIERAGLEKIDFLKCDIEGGEFALLRQGSKLLQMTDKIGVEVHAFGGNVSGFIEMIEKSGFNLLHVKTDPSGTRTVLARR